MAAENHRRSRSEPNNDQHPTSDVAQASNDPPDPDNVRPNSRPTQKLDDPDAFRDSFKRKPKGSWHHNVTVPWKEKWPEDSWEGGRVLMIDCMRWNRSKGGKVKVAGQEIRDLHGLKKYYSDDQRCTQSALRVVHVQNAQHWAVPYLMKKYNIGPEDDLVGTDFGKWVKFDQPEWRAGKPLLKGKTWRTQRDPWRAIRRTGFGMDYLRAWDVRSDAEGSHQANSEARQGQTQYEDNKMMELSCYDEADAPCYGWDVFVQRLSCYVQFSEGDTRSPAGMKSPYDPPKDGHEQDPEKEKWHENTAANGDPHHAHSAHHAKLPPLSWLDNGNTIIIFESSQDRSVTNTLIGARQQIESRWRRLSLYLEDEAIAEESRLALECMDLVIEDIFKALATGWESFFNIAETHIAILEDKIYDSPADESRAPELWYNSSWWLKVERLCYIHLECVKELVTHLDDLPNKPELARTWLDGVTEQFDKVITLVQEDLVKPTNNLSDLMYKSVEIRDSRQSLSLGTSMWRLSWITFIFLPLTFIVGFFGMNVDTFQENPSIKWYFIAAVPLMVLVLILWYTLKHALQSRHRTPYQRGIYEHLYHDLASINPTLWSRGGPRRGVEPLGFYSRLRWWFLRHWFDPKRTIARPRSDPDEDIDASDLGAWARMKRMLARRWLGTIDARRRASISESEIALTDDPLNTLVAESTSAAVAETTPQVANVTAQNLARLSPPAPRNRSASPRVSARSRPSSSGGSSGIMVEERDPFSDKRASRDMEPWSAHGGIRGSIDGVMQTFDVQKL